MITVLLANDHASVRKSLRYLLETTDDIQVIATASTGAEAIAKASFYYPDVAILDLSMPLMDGIKATREIRVRCPLTRIMMLSIYDNAEYVHRALEVGALGYVLKDMIGDDLLAAVRALHSGGRYFSQKIAEIAQKYMNQTGNDS